MWVLKMTSVVLLVLVLVPGVCCGPADGWVVFTNPSPCGVRGSSVVLGCSYPKPSGHTVTTTTWFKGRLTRNQWTLTPLSDLPSYGGQFKYVGEDDKGCSLNITNLQDSDEGYYNIMVEVVNDQNKYNWNSEHSLFLFVTGLTARVKHSTVREGEQVNLTCTTTCNLPGNTDMVWFRDGKPVPNPEFQASREDAGNYTCAVKGQETVRSDPVILDVQFGPEKVTLSVSPSGEVAKGSSVTLTCSSDANPAVTEQGYRLLKRVGQRLFYPFEASGKGVYTIANIQPSDSGQYYCQALSGSKTAKSHLVHLNVQYPPVSVKVSVDHVGPIRAGSSVTLTCSSDANPEVEVNAYLWFSSNERTTALKTANGSPLSSGSLMLLDNISAHHLGWYVCVGQNKHGLNTSLTHFLNVTYAPVNVRVEVSPPGSLAEGSSVNLTCSGDANPAVHSYTWYRRTGTPSSSSLVGTGQVLSLASLDPSQTGHYLCQARNSLGENNSNLVEPEIEEDLEIDPRLILFVLIGVKLVAVLILPFVMVWTWRHRDSKESKRKDTIIKTVPRGPGRRGLITLSNQDTGMIEQEVSL